MNKDKDHFIVINPWLLLAIYAVMPLSLIFMAMDSLVFGEQIKQSLPVDPRVYTLFILLFMVPHIIGSFFSFADKDYFRHYKSKLLTGAQIAVVLGLFIPAITNTTILPVLIFVFYTMVHVFMQQSGISKSLMKNASPNQVYWQWVGIIIAITIYAYLLVPIPWLKDIFQNSWVIAISALVLVVYCILAFSIVKKSRTQLGKVYFLGSHFIPIMGVLYIILGYPILTLVVPRVIHDLTAFYFYITHDCNRFAKTQSNPIYKLTTKFRIPIILANPAISILLAFIISKFNSASLSVVLSCVFFLHYYTESFIWKKDTLHRTQIAYSSYK